jgi:hypothetical protein
VRSAVERKNSQLKRGTTINLDNAGKRPQRALNAPSISDAMLVAAHNLIQIQEYLVSESPWVPFLGFLLESSRSQE